MPPSTYTGTFGCRTGGDRERSAAGAQPRQGISRPAQASGLHALCCSEHVRCLRHLPSFLIIVQQLIDINNAKAIGFQKLSLAYTFLMIFFSLLCLKYRIFSSF
jgi:hypothetical protein